MRRRLTAVAIVLAALACAAVASAAGSPITNGSFQLGNFTGWTLVDSTHCPFYCGSGVASIVDGGPAWHNGDSYTASLSGSNVWVGQYPLGNVTYKKFQVSVCLSHAGSGNAIVRWISGPTDYYSGNVARTCDVFGPFLNPSGSPVGIPGLMIKNVGGSSLFDDYVVTSLP